MGICYHYKGTFEGKRHDLKVFQHSNLPGFLLKRTRIEDGPRENFHPFILADSGYQGVQNFFPEVILPTKKPKGENSLRNIGIVTRKYLKIEL